MTIQLRTETVPGNGELTLTVPSLRTWQILSVVCEVGTNEDPYTGGLVAFMEYKTQDGPNLVTFHRQVLIDELIDVGVDPSAFKVSAAIGSAYQRDVHEVLGYGFLGISLPLVTLPAGSKVVISRGNDATIIDNLVIALEEKVL